MSNCIFCKIAKHEVPKEFTYEDRDVMVFPDIRPVKPVHLLIMPKEHIVDFSNLTDDSLLSKLRVMIQKMIKEQKLQGRGYRLVVHGGGAQIIDHLHIHLLGPVGKAASI